MPDAKKQIHVVLGFDFGLKRIGVAVGQTVTQSATPLAPLKAEKGIPQWKEIAKCIEVWRPDAFIVGIPYRMDDSEQPITKQAHEFAAALERFSLPIIKIDERLSTKEARQRLFDMGGYRALQETSIDSFAAKLIVETWLKGL